MSNKVDIYVHFKQNFLLETLASFNGIKDSKIATLTKENNLVYKDEGHDFFAHSVTTTKFALITAASPLIAVARIIRSIAFACSGNFNRSGREFVGAFTPVVAAVCLAGTLLSSVIYVISMNEVSFYVSMRRTYAFFEAWVNNIDLNDTSLASYSQRVSNPADFIGQSRGVHQRVWTTAPCMQPVLEKGDSEVGGLYDVERMRRIFPNVIINKIKNENGNPVIQSENRDRHVEVVACGGACAHVRTSSTDCCCYKVDCAYDRILCCEVGKGNCTSTCDPDDKCGIVFCSVCGCAACCCCTAGQNDLVAVGTCVAC